MAPLSLPRRCPIGPLILLTLALLFDGRSARAHNGEPPPPPPGPPAGPSGTPTKFEIQQVEPPRWSWIHWWEANRDRYLKSPAQSAALQVTDDAALKMLRDEAARELVKAVESSQQGDKSGQVRIEAAVALGKMRHASGLDAIKQLVDRAESARGRRPVLAAIGLMGSPEAETALTSYRPASREDEVAALASLGFLQDVQPDTLNRLRKGINADNPGVATAVCFALRQHHEKNNTEYYRSLLNVNESLWVACEALLAMGRKRDGQAVRLLEGVMFGDEQARREVKAFEVIERLGADRGNARDARDPASYDRAYKGYEEAYDRWKRNNPNDARDRGLAGRKKTVTEVLVIGPELIDMARLRSSAAVALGDIDQPRAATALLRFLQTDRGPVDADVYLNAPMGFAIMSLASYPSDASRDRLITLLGKQDDAGKMALDVGRDSPLRGYAALALGLYARPYDTDQGPADRPGFDRAVLTLAERLEDAKEDAEVRSACALALGLSQRTAVLPVMNRAAAAVVERNRRQDQMIVGYLLLGRALAGDQNVIEPAARMLQTSADDTSPPGILARRAAVLSLGLTGSSQAIPVLTQAWHLNHYVNREVIHALRLVGGTNAATPLMARLRDAKDAEERAYMAHALGELLAVEHPTPLSRLTAQANYTVRNDQLKPLQSLANGFLYDYLIASFGEEW